MSPPRLTRTMKKSYFVFVSTNILALLLDAPALCLGKSRRRAAFSLSVSFSSPLFVFHSFFAFFLAIVWKSTEKNLDLFWDSGSFCSFLAPACFARKIKGYEYHFNLPMAAASFSFPFEWPNFWMRFQRLGSHRVILSFRALPSSFNGPRTAKLMTWPRDSPSPGFEGWRRTRSVGAREPTNVGFQAFWSAPGYMYIYSATFVTANFVESIDFTRP